MFISVLTHWGRVTHICVSKLNIIGSDHGLSPGRGQAIIWTNNGTLLIYLLPYIYIYIYIYGSLLGKLMYGQDQIHKIYQKMNLKIEFAKWITWLTFNIKIQKVQNFAKIHLPAR